MPRPLEFAHIKSANEFHHGAVEPKRDLRLPHGIREARTRFPSVGVTPIREEPVSVFPNCPDCYDALTTPGNFAATVDVISNGYRFCPNRRHFQKMAHLGAISHLMKERALVHLSNGATLVGLRHKVVKHAPILNAEAFRVSVQPLCE